ncbi:MAG: 4Fe-4S binding protein [Bacteroidales bacterium]|nr:4Fe-4S binding protein [Bacteroidales bacterium]
MLKKLRVVIAVAFLLFFAFVFIDIKYVTPEWWIFYISRLQFTPALLNLIVVGGFAIISLIFILMLTVLFGRVYCSTLCPLGTLQDVLTRIFNPKKKMRRFKYHKPNNWLRYSILAITAILFIFGSSLLLNLLDPYSNFGKIFSNLMRPLNMLINNELAAHYSRTGTYAINPVEVKGFQLFSIAYAALFLAIIGFLSAWRGRLFCNTICPVGTFLSLISRKSLFQIHLDHAKCNSCGLCAITCKAECIDAKSKNVDMSRCVGCFNCLSACKSNGVLYSIPVKVKSDQEIALPDKRRRFLIGGLLTSAAVFSGMKVLGEEEKRHRGRGQGRGRGRGNQEAPVPVVREFPVSPPGSICIEHFNSTCTACHLCITACPKQVLVPAFTEYGLMGLMQPRLDYGVSFCNYECVVCSQICPTGAIIPLANEEKKRVQIGIAHFVRRNCVVITDKTDCGACAEHCPTQAVRMVLHRNGLFVPEVTDNICVGCGACEHACPTDPKAIYVDGNHTHLVAEMPVIETIEKNIDLDDFPF